MFTFVTLAFGLLPLSQENQGLGQYSHMKLPAHGILHKDQLFGFFDNKPSGYPVQAIGLDHPSNNKSRRYTGGFLQLGYYYRHHIKFNALWIGLGDRFVDRVPLDELDMFEIGNRDDFLKQYRKRYPRSEGPERSHVLILNALSDRYLGLKIREGIQGLDLRRPQALVGLGWVPISENTVKVFFLAKNKKLEVWETKAKFNSKKQQWDLVDDNINPESIEPLFEEDFYPFVRQNDYYFVTQSGRLFHAPPPEGAEKTRIMKPLWDNISCPIVAIIEDADRDQVWLFARSKNPNLKLDVFFEMKETTRAQSFDPAKLRPVNVEGRAKALLEYLPLISGKDKK